MSSWFRWSNVDSHEETMQISVVRDFAHLNIWLPVVLFHAWRENKTLTELLGFWKVSKCLSSLNMHSVYWPAGAKRLIFVHVSVLSNQDKLEDSHRPQNEGCRHGSSVRYLSNSLRLHINITLLLFRETTVVTTRGDKFLATNCEWVRQSCHLRTRSFATGHNNQSGSCEWAQWFQFSSLSQRDDSELCAQERFFSLESSSNTISRLELHCLFWECNFPQGRVWKTHLWWCFFDNLCHHLRESWGWKLIVRVKNQPEP